MKPSVYIETTIRSYLTAWPSRDLVRAAHQHVTRQWWARREAFRLFVSELVVTECKQGDPEAARARLEVRDGIDLLGHNAAITALAKSLCNGLSLPVRARVDAFHIATAAAHGIDYLLTWNCRHLANATFRDRIDAACREAGLRAPLICTPFELQAGGES